MSGLQNKKFLKLQNRSTVKKKKKKQKKTCVKWPLSKRPKIGFQYQFCLMQVKCIAECSKGSILLYFRPSLSYHLSLRSLFCLLFVIKIFVLSIFEWPFYTGFTVHVYLTC